MKRTKVLTGMMLLILGVLLFATCSGNQQNQGPSDRTVSKVRFGVSAFQDTLVPIIGRDKDWYRNEGLDVEFSILGWTEVMEALSAGHVDVAINNIYAVVQDHQQNPNLVFYYGLNPFDQGAALMVRPDGRIKTLEQMLKEFPDHETAVRMTALQLKNKSIITLGGSDMEQSVLAATRKADLQPQKDFKLISLEPDEGLAAFLRGEGDAYLGGIPQRTAAAKRGMKEMLTGLDLGPPPINGLVTTRQYAETHQEELLKIIRVWFRIVQHVNSNLDDGASIVVKEMNAHGSKFTTEDFKKYWNNYESYPANPTEVQSMILDPNGKNYWKAQWEDCNYYLHDVTGKIKKVVQPEDAFWMEKAQRAYVEKYGSE